MRTCGGCGEENPDRARFCLACGRPLEEEAPERFRRVVTILFSDVVDSTGLGERLDPETLDTILTEYFEGVKPVVERHGGVLAKFVGDAVMAVFGLTELHEDDALRAVRSALEMREALTPLNDDFERRYGVALATRTGISTGTVAGKGIVPDRNFVAGDTANTAARLQQHAEPGDVLLADSTYRLVRDLVDAEPVPHLALKGKQEASTAPGCSRCGARSSRRGCRLRWSGATTRSPSSSGRSSGPSPRTGAGSSPSSARPASASRGSRTSSSRGSGSGRPCCRAVPALRRGHHVLGARRDGQQAAAIHEADGGEDAVAKLEALLAPAEDARAVAEAIAQLAGLVETRGVVEEGFWAVRRLFARLARDRPLVVMLDDAHWAEPMLLALVENVTRHTELVPILLVCLSRPDLLERRADWGQKAERSTIIRLEPLDDAACDRLIGELLGESAPALEVRDHVAARQKATRCSSSR